MNLKIDLKELKSRIFDMKWLELGQSNRFLSIDFSHGVVKMACFESHIDKISLLAYKIVKASSKEEIIDVINAFCDANNMLNSDFVISISDSQSLAIKYLTLPVIPKNEVFEAAKWPLKDDVPFDLSDAAADWQIVREFTDEEGIRKNDIVFVLAKKELINQYVSIAGECQLKPLSITTPSLSYANILNRIANNPQISAVLDIDYKEANLCVYINSQLIYVRTLPISWEKIANALKEIIVPNEGTVKVTFEEAEKILKTIGVAGEKDKKVKGKIKTQHVLSVLRPLLEALVRDLKFSFDYFSSIFKLDKPALLYLTGAGANIKNLDRYLKNECGSEVSFLPLPSHLEVSQQVDENTFVYDRSVIVSVIGASLGGIASVNLLPANIKARRTRKVFMPVFRILGVAFFGILLFMLFSVNYQIKDYKNRLKYAHMHLETVRIIDELEKETQIKEELVKKIQYDKIPADGMLKIISSLIPHEIALDELHLSQSSRSISLKGRIPVKETDEEMKLTEFMQLLESSPVFAEVELVSRDTEGTMERFELKCDIYHEYKQ